MSTTAVVPERPDAVQSMTMAARTVIGMRIDHPLPARPLIKPLGQFHRLLVPQPFLKPTFPPFREILFPDLRAREVGLQHRLHLRQPVEPFDERVSGLAFV